MAFNATSFGQVLNISEGGLLYKSLLDQAEPAPQTFAIGLLNSAEGHYIDRLPCELVQINDSPPLLPTSNTIIRQASIKFVNLSPAQRQSLQRFVKDNCLANA